jgi:hypothetical protein
MGLYEGDPTRRLCRKGTETVQHVICCCEALARQRYYVFGNSFVEPKDISTASVRNLCFFRRGTGLLNVCWMEHLGLHNKPKAEVQMGRILVYWRALKKKKKKKKKRRRRRLTFTELLFSLLFTPRNAKYYNNKIYIVSTNIDKLYFVLNILFYWLFITVTYVSHLPY